MTSLLVFSAGFSDGPLAVIRGGVFTSGELVTSEPDWTFAKDVTEIEFQLLNPATSRTAWIAVADGRVFIPSGYMDTTFGRLWKQWPIQVEKDNRTILRIDGKLYERHLVRVIDDPIVPAVLAELSRKYGAAGTATVDMVASGSMWLFELTRRES